MGGIAAQCSPWVIALPAIPGALLTSSRLTAWARNACERMWPEARRKPARTSPSEITRSAAAPRPAHSTSPAKNGMPKPTSTTSAQETSTLLWPASQFQTGLRNPLQYASYGNPQTLNLYSYVKNDPTTTDDHDGHDSILDNTARMKGAKSQASVSQKHSVGCG